MPNGDDKGMDGGDDTDGSTSSPSGGHCVGGNGACDGYDELSCKMEVPGIVGCDWVYDDSGGRRRLGEGLVPLFDWASNGAKRPREQRRLNPGWECHKTDASGTRLTTYHAPSHTCVATFHGCLSACKTERSQEKIGNFDLAWTCDCHPCDPSTCGLSAADMFKGFGRRLGATKAATNHGHFAALREKGTC